MTTQHKDIRLVDDPQQSGELRSLLRAGIDDEVAGYDFQAGLASHLAAVAALPPAASAPHVAPAAAAGVSGKALLAWIGIPVASVSVIAALWLSNSTEPAATVTTANRGAAPVALVAPAAAIDVVAPSAPVAPAEATVSAKPTIEHVAARAPVPAVRSDKSVRVQRNAAAVTAITPDYHEAVAAEPVDTEPAVPVAQPIAAEAQAVQAAPTAAEQEALARKAAEQAEQDRLAREEARRVAEARLKREMAQLMQATQALTSNPARSLSLAQAGEQEFQNSLFSEERQHVLLLALIKLGRVAEAERRAEPYLRAHPDSPFARRVRNALQEAK